MKRARISLSCFAGVAALIATGDVAMSSATDTVVVNVPDPLRVMQLPIRPADYRRYPRAEFEFSLDTSDGIGVNSFEGTLSKPIDVMRDTVISVRLSEAEMDTIYRKMIEIQLFEYLQPHPPIRGAVTRQPNTTYRLLARAGSVERRLEWSSGRPDSPVPSAQWIRLYELVRLIVNIVANRPEYKAIPDELAETAKI